MKKQEFEWKKIEAARKEYDKRIQHEEEFIRHKEKEIMEMEMLEMELIKRLQST